MHYKKPVVTFHIVAFENMTLNFRFTKYRYPTRGENTSENVRFIKL